MNLPLLILRPLDGALQTERRAKELDLHVVVDPLFAVEPIAWSGPEAQDFDALLLTSANALRFGGPQLNAYRSLPILAVGEKTAAAAIAAGLHVAETGATSAQDLLGGLEDGRYRNILWLAGHDHTDLSATDQQLEIVPVYRSNAIALGEQAKACLAGETVILLHSARAARHFVSELDRSGLPKSQHRVLAFSGKVAEAAGQGWKMVQTASHPDDDALLSLASALCR
ncbi:uroporphyrinogen-III synthase [uncultured Parasphingorhabdus sp.]|uniref:uroporphyrinogen-III synthase n=1 Tax=uncultured Parasphingorhabdus sp. TaxID=2709694 RepID=UPI0030DCBF5F|tara:strand:+ start:766 stop:1446 length:681 start_codon:yes stop_codon:yes gene_type:complete